MDNSRQAAWVLALAGFLPFGFGMVVEWLPYSADVATLKAITIKMLPLYGAVILSFLGGIRWGIAIAHATTERIAPVLAASVLPSLWAWVAVFFASPINYLMLAVGFAAMGWWDRGLAANPFVPIWFITLRKVLTWLVAISLLLAAIGTNSALLSAVLAQG